MGVNLTETAALHVTRYLEERGSGIGIRLAVTDNRLFRPDVCA